MGDILSPVHIVLLLVIALLVFGPRRLPEIGSGLGKSIREFKQSVNGMMKDSEGSKEKASNEFSTEVVLQDESTPK